jgi:acyl carrier protein
MDDIALRLIGCFRMVFPDTPEQNITGLSTGNTAAWDSVAAITLMNVIEDEFHVQLDVEDIAELDSFQRVQDYVQQRIGPAKS